MANKDLIERVTSGPGNKARTPARPPAASPAAPASAAQGGASSQEVRVGNVIRRRQATEEPARPGRAPAPAAPPAAAVIRRRPAEAPAPPAAPPPVAPVAEPPAPVAAAPVAEAAPPAPAAKPEPVVIPPTAPPAAEPAAAPPVADAAAPAPAAAAPAPEPAAAVAAAPPAPAPAEAPPPAPAARPELPRAARPEPARPEAQRVEPQRPTARPEAPRPAAEAADAPSAARLARALPRADGSGPPGAGPRLRRPGDGPQSFPGLGSAVVRPPPGYDPNDPMGNRRRAQEAAATSTNVRGPRPGPAAPAGAGPAAGQPGRPWRDEPAAPPAEEAGGDDRSRARRKKGADRRRGAVDMMGVDAFGGRRRRTKGRPSLQKQSPQAKAIKRRIEVNGTITVTNLAHALSVKSGQVIKALMGMGQMATANDVLDFDTASLVANEFEFEVINSSFQEDKLMIDIEDSDEDMVGRPPVVTIMGHVDHGKTTLLDTIRKADVAAGEAGGITQHISSYQVEHNGQLITFIDTPGHAAFTAMRARGAQVTDIVVLVVAADDGVMPQTVEVINHAKAADVEIIVAVNKCDKPDAKPARVRQQMMEYGLVSEEFGGETMFVDVSAMTGKGVPDLLEAISVIAEVEEYASNPERHAEGTVIEARLERGKGPVATVLVQAGTLNRGDHFVVGTTWGRVRALTDHRGKALKTATPSTPVEIMGLQDVPQAGDSFVVVGSDKDAKTLAEHRAEEARQKSLSQHKRMTLEELLKRGNAEEKATLNLIVRADVGGSLEALRASFGAIQVEGTDIKILHDGVGAVTESDVTLAHTNHAAIIAFNVRPDANARKIIDGFGVEVRTYKIIYEAIEDVEKALRGLLAPEEREVVQGAAEIRQIFSVPKVGNIAGCFVTDGKIARSHSIRLLRQGKIVWEGRLGSLKRFKDDVREVNSGYECGMSLDGYNDIKMGDVIEAFTKESVSAS